MSRLLPTLVLWLWLAPAAIGVTLQPGFQHETVLTGLQFPTSVRFSPDGRVFVAEKSGLIQVFSGLGDPTPTVFADLRRQVFNAWDRGLLGFVLHPDFPTTPWAYVLYTHNALPGGADPQWPSSDPEMTFDYCPDPPGGMVDGCVVTGRLSRLAIDGPTQVTEHVLIENNWCQQYPSHSVGDLAFGPDGALYVSAGEGASFGGIDWGQYGGTVPDPILAPIPRNPCGDPPGDAMTTPTAEGGALRAQDLRTPGDPVSFSGTILRVDPETGAALPDNPLWGGAAPDDDRIVAYGFRNPFRLTVRPGTSELWIGDVGWDGWEEINRVADPTGLSVANFGWPCWEGSAHQPAYDGANLALCESLYGDGTDTKPFLASRHGEPLGDAACTSASSSITGLAFYGGGTYPAEYSNALFFLDYGRNCLWAMLPDENGVPDPTAIVTVAADLPGPVTLERGPGGDLFYVEVGGFGWLDGKVHRIRYLGSNHPPVAVATANVNTGASPLEVQFDGSASSDSDAGDALAFAWDLDGDGEFDDGGDPQPSYTYGTGTWRVRLRVTDSAGASSTAAVTVSVDNTPPTAIISSPTPSLRWNVGQPIVLNGSGIDAEEGTLPASALRWQIVMLHCPGFDCHVHLVQELGGGSGAVFVAPDHEYPSFLEIVLTAVDAGGLSHTTSVQLQANTASLRFDSIPSGLALAVGSTADVTPFARNVIVGSQMSVSALSPQVLAGSEYTFATWSDGGAEAHNVLATAGGGSWVATFDGGVCGNGLRDAGEACDDGNQQDGDCCTATCTLAPAGTACRTAAGPCDVAETCDGASSTCPADTLAPAARECRAATGPCDVAETCTGASTACPADAFAPTTWECRAAAGPCDVPETCTGANPACPTDALAPSTQECRAAAGPCDVAETCTGASTACPTDAFANSAQECRAATGPCDAPETCTGAGPACPADALAPPTQECRPAAGPCDVPETCTGADPACPTDALAPATRECRPAADACDPAERCTGTTPSCPADIGSRDADGDGLCTGSDPCTGGVSFRSARLRVRGLGARAGKGRLELSASAMLPAESTALVDPPARGARLLLQDTAGATILDTALPAGPEWKATGAGSWRYRTARGGSGGITRVALRLSRSTGLLTVRVAGRNATYPPDGARKPLVLTLVLDPPAASTGLCAEQVAWPRGCTVGSGGSSAFCR